METFIAAAAVAIWLVLMIPAALVFLTGSDPDVNEATAPPELVIAPSALRTEDASPIAA